MAGEGVMSQFNTMFWIILALLCIIGWLSITLLLRKIDDIRERKSGQIKLNVIMVGVCICIAVVVFYPQVATDPNIIVGQR